MLAADARGDGTGSRGAAPLVLTREHALDLFARRRDAWLASDLDTYLAPFAPDVTQSPSHAEPLRGREAFAALVRRSAVEPW